MCLCCVPVRLIMQCSALSPRAAQNRLKSRTAFADHMTGSDNCVCCAGNNLHFPLCNIQVVTSLHSFCCLMLIFHSCSSFVLGLSSIRLNNADIFLVIIFSVVLPCQLKIDPHSFPVKFTELSALYDDVPLSCRQSTLLLLPW